jgi:hypothetical protein
MLEMLEMLIMHSYAGFNPVSSIVYGLSEHPAFQKGWIMDGQETLFH